MDENIDPLDVDLLQKEHINFDSGSIEQINIDTFSQDFNLCEYDENQKVESLTDLAKRLNVNIYSDNQTSKKGPSVYYVIKRGRWGKPNDYVVNKIGLLLVY